MTTVWENHREIAAFVASNSVPKYLIDTFLDNEQVSEQVSIDDFYRSDKYRHFIRYMRNHGQPILPTQDDLTWIVNGDIAPTADKVRLLFLAKWSLDFKENQLENLKLDMETQQRDHDFQLANTWNKTTKCGVCYTTYDYEDMHVYGKCGHLVCPTCLIGIKKATDQWHHCTILRCPFCREESKGTHKLRIE